MAKLKLRARRTVKAATLASISLKTQDNFSHIFMLTLCADILILPSLFLCFIYIVLQ